MSARFFGKSEQPLFGIFHPARGRSGSNNNVLICPPLGHEFVRTHWALRNLASKLSRKGMNVFRFDYRGTGDSSGEIENVTSLQQLVDDATSAAIELLETVNEPNAKLSIIGLRMGGVIGALAANELSEDHVVADNVLCWDCPRDGATYLSELRSMHRRMVDLWSSKIETENSDSHEEILGFRFSRSVLNEIEQYQAENLPSHYLNKLTAVNSSNASAAWANLDAESVSEEDAEWSLVTTEDPSDWDDLNYIEEAWLPTHGSANVVDLLSQPTPKRTSQRSSQTNTQTTSANKVPVGAK